MIALFDGPLDGRVMNAEPIGACFKSALDLHVDTGEVRTVTYAWERVWEYSGQRHATAVFDKVEVENR